MRFLWLLFFLYPSFFAGYASVDRVDIKISVMSDIHFLSSRLAGEGAALAAYEKSTGRNIRDQHAVLEQVLGEIEKEMPEILLITGDMSNHGERLSHLDLIEKLQPLQQKGIRILVIPGNHDISIPDAKAYHGAQTAAAESISKEEFGELYSKFGYGDALSRDEASLSYLSAIDEKTWLLCLDTNRYDEHTTTSVTGGRIRPQTLEWALAVLHEAKEKGISVLGMMHHGLVEHMSYQSAFFPDYLVEDWERHAELLADAGLRIVFTGHFHANDISLRTSAAGNTVYDVETATLAHFPFAWRLMNWSGAALSVETRFVTSLRGNTGFEEETRQRLESFTRRVVRNRLEKMGMLIPGHTSAALTEVIVQMSLLHARGDEKPDGEMETAIRHFATLMGDEAETDTVILDFPPGDNNVVIQVKDEMK